MPKVMRRSLHRRENNLKHSFTLSIAPPIWSGGYFAQRFAAHPKLRSNLRSERVAAVVRCNFFYHSVIIASSTVWRFSIANDAAHFRYYQHR